MKLLKGLNSDVRMVIRFYIRSVASINVHGKEVEALIKSGCERADILAMINQAKDSDYKKNNDWFSSAKESTVN